MTADRAARAAPSAALAEGRHGDALVDGFRALAVRQVERGRLDDVPGATAHEVAAAARRGVPRASAARVDGSAAALRRRCCTATGRPRRDQAAVVLALDDELAVPR